MSNANVSSKRDTKSFNYVIRSGIAGGFAGCVVCIDFQQTRISQTKGRPKL